MTGCVCWVLERTTVRHATFDSRAVVTLIDEPVKRADVRVSFETPEAVPDSMRAIPSMLSVRLLQCMQFVNGTDLFRANVQLDVTGAVQRVSFSDAHRAEEPSRLCLGRVLMEQPFPCALDEASRSLQMRLLFRPASEQGL